MIDGLGRRSADSSGPPLLVRRCGSSYGGHFFGATIAGAKVARRTGRFPQLAGAWSRV